MIDIQAIRDRAKSPDPYANLQVLDLCDEVDQLRGRWISVDERLPEEAEQESKPFGLCWLVTDGKDVAFSQMHPANWNKEDADGFTEMVTHWMPLPEPPEDKP